MRRLTALSLILPLFLSATIRAGEGTIKIAVCGPMTGDQGKMGEDIFRGAELAVSEWNAKGGILGRKIEVLPGDDQHDPKQARAVAQRMKNEGVSGVVGHFNTSCTIPASDVYFQASIPMITPSSTNPQVTLRGHPNVFRVCGTDDQQAQRAARFTVEVAKAKRVAILHDNTTYGKGFADYYKAALEGKAGVAYYGGIVQGDLDFKATLAAVKDAKPDFWFFGGMYPEAAKLVKQARELGLNATFLSGDGTFDPEFLKIAGRAAEGCILTFGPDLERLPTARAFLEAYHKKYGPHGAYSVYAYDAANVLLAAMAEAKTTEGEKVCAAIRAREHDGAFGKIAFDQKGDVKLAPYICWKVVDGKYEALDDPKPEPGAERLPHLEKGWELWSAKTDKGWHFHLQNGFGEWVRQPDGSQAREGGPALEAASIEGLRHLLCRLPAGESVVWMGRGLTTEGGVIPGCAHLAAPPSEDLRAEIAALAKTQGLVLKFVID